MVKVYKIMAFLMAIPQHTIDQIPDRTDIVDLIGQRVKLKNRTDLFWLLSFSSGKVTFFPCLP